MNSVHFIQNARCFIILSVMSLIDISVSLPYVVDPSSKDVNGHRKDYGNI